MTFNQPSLPEASVAAGFPAGTPDTAVATCVVDLGVGNLGNLARALAAAGASVEITADPQTVRRSRCLVLPGVGAFRPPRERLRGALEQALVESLRDGGHVLGICVGFQLLFEEGEEFGTCDGLGLLPGAVRRLPALVPLPHIGWNRLLVEPLVGGVESPLLSGLGARPHAYFVHSYAPEGTPSEYVPATCLHGRRFPAVVARGRVFGTQFHPEKSGSVGLRLLANFLEICRGSDSGD